MQGLHEDPKRRSLPETGIYVRALRNEDGKERWSNVDMAHLDRDSLRVFLRSRGGENLWAENILATLLGHDPWSHSES